jgi:hypothetical protein
MTSKQIDATFYAQVEGKVTQRWSGSEWIELVESAKVVAITQNRPGRPKGGTVLVKLTVRIPEAAFLPLRPEAIVVIPEDMTAPYPIEVEAGDPS